MARVILRSEHVDASHRILTEVDRALGNQHRVSLNLLESASFEITFDPTDTTLRIRAPSCSLHRLSARRAILQCQ